ncbi:MAG: roadblock/LC7 domain-containing protein [Promethearchaeota archaeon]
MRICSNCGATNHEEEGSVCRKCGALLPVSRSSRRRRIEMPTDEVKQKKPTISQEKPLIENNQIARNNQKAIQANPEVTFFAPQEKSSEPIKHQFDLQEIPLPEESAVEDSQSELVQIPTVKSTIKTQKKFTSERPSVKQLPRENGISLQEIKPQPYQGTILKPTVPNLQESANQSNSKNYSSLPALKPIPPGKSPNKIKTKQTKQNVSKSNKNVTLQATDNIASMQKQKQLDLEQDMIKVLKFLSSKLSLPEKQTLAKGEIHVEKKLEKQIKPSSLNEILKSLLTMDRYIEAAALLKTDGTILAAAISTRISDSLFATIGQNLSMIGTDIIHGLSAGDLQSISVRGTNGILDLAPLNKNSPIVKDMILMIFSHPNVRSGMINFAVKNVEKQIIEFLNGN